MHTMQLRRPSTAIGRRPCRHNLTVHALHKALRQPSAGPITNPADVVYECLTLLRRPDLESLAPFLPADVFDASMHRVSLEVGGQMVVEAGPLACCHRFMDTAARRVLPGHLLRRCRVLSSVVLGDRCQQRVALTACTGEEAVFVWRLRRATHGSAASGSGSGSGASSQEALPRSAPGRALVSHVAEPRDGGHEAPAGAEGAGSARGGDTPGAAMSARNAGSSGAAAELRRISPTGQDCQASSGPSRIPPCSASDEAATGTSSAHGGDAPRSSHGLPREAETRYSSSWPPTASSPRPLGPDSSLHPPSSTSASGHDSATPLTLVSDQNPDQLTAWVVESITRDDSNDEEELPPPGLSHGGGGGPHPRCSPELVVKAQLGALRHGDLVGAASFNLWSRSTSGGWELHLSAFKSLLRQPAYAPLVGAAGAELGPSALPSPRRMLQEVRLRGGRGARGGGGGGSGGGAGANAEGFTSGTSVMVYQLGMQANGCWVVEAIRAA